KSCGYDFCHGEGICPEFEKGKSPKETEKEKGSLSEMLELNKIYNIDCLEGLKQLPDNSINCCVTSPPYWGLRDYGVEGQLGLESTPEEYVTKMVEVFRLECFLKTDLGKE